MRFDVSVSLVDMLENFHHHKSVLKIKEAFKSSWWIFFLQELIVVEV